MLTNPLKKLKAENKELAEELKNRMFAEAEKQNEGIKRLKRRRAERGRRIIAQAEMAQTIVEKVKENYLKKTLIEV